MRTTITVVALVTAALAALSLSACAELTTSQRAEGAWQALNAIDMAQTDHAARAGSCFSEQDPLSRALVGEHPSQAEAAALGLFYATGHNLVSRWLDRKVEADASTGWHQVRAAWHILGIGYKTALVARNHEIGLRIGGSRMCDPEMVDPIGTPPGRPIK